MKYPVHEGDTVRVTLAYPDTGPSVPPAASQDSLAADESFGPDAPGESGQEGTGSEAESGADAAPPQGESVDARLAEGTAGRCCKEFEVQQVGEDGLYGKNIFVPWDQIQSIQLAQPDHLKTAALVVTFPLWFPLAVVSVALVAGPIALGAAEIALTPSAR